MSNQQQGNTKSVLATGTIIFIVALVIVSSLPSVKKLFGEQVLFWRIVYPLMAFVSMYAVYDAFRSKARVLTLLKFMSLLIWTGCRSLMIYEILVYPFVGLMSTLSLLSFLVLSLIELATNRER